MNNIWIKLVFSAVVSALMGANALADEACDMNAGKKHFNKCAACHSLTEGTHMMGPSLHGTLNRPAGKVDGFLFSMALEESQLLWTKENLSEFLASPMKKLPGTSMPFGGLKKAEQRDAIICYIDAKSK